MTAELVTGDGQRLVADLAEPLGPRRGAVVLCHPHPLYGGDRFHPLIDSLFRALPDAGFAALRFDFRSAHDHGVGEQLDVAAAVDAVSDGDGPIFVVGYSFGAVVAMATEHPLIAGVVVVAPPLGEETPAPSRPTLILSPRHDQFCSFERAEGLAAPWPGASVEVIESTDHFLHGRIAWITERVIAWLGPP